MAEKQEFEEMEKDKVVVKTERDAKAERPSEVRFDDHRIVVEVWVNEKAILEDRAAGGAVRPSPDFLA